ncbi:hypothetical protein [Desulfocicer vacuolatum]|nr:hypothetical protein [Desulfocicer vacuolatum]
MKNNSIRKLCELLEKDLEVYSSFPGQCVGTQKWLTALQSRGFWAVAVFRYGYWLNHEAQWEKKGLCWNLLKLLFHFANYVIRSATKIMIGEMSVIGPGLFLSNRGEIVMGVQKMGNHCIVDTRVTIGMGEDQVPPEIGDNVCIESDTVVYGNIQIGNRVHIHAGTVLSKNVPDDRVVRGNPGRIQKNTS